MTSGTTYQSFPQPTRFNDVYRDSIISTDARTREPDTGFKVRMTIHDLNMRNSASKVESTKYENTNIGRHVEDLRELLEERKTQHDDVKKAQSTCTHDVKKAQSTCTHDVKKAQSTCTHDVKKAQSTCTHDVKKAQSTCTHDVKKAQSTCTHSGSSRPGFSEFQDSGKLLDQLITKDANNNVCLYAQSPGAETAVPASPTVPVTKTLAEDDKVNSPGPPKGTGDLIHPAEQLTGSASTVRGMENTTFRKYEEPGLHVCSRMRGLKLDGLFKPWVGPKPNRFSTREVTGVDKLNFDRKTLERLWTLKGPEPYGAIKPDGPLDSQFDIVFKPTGFQLDGYQELQRPTTTKLDKLVTPQGIRQNGLFHPLKVRPDRLGHRPEGIKSGAERKTHGRYPGLQHYPLEQHTIVRSASPVSLKVILLGDYGIGKASLLEALSKAASPERAGISCTDFRPKEYVELTLEGDGRKLRVKVVSTAGQERYRSLTSSYYRDVHGCLLVFGVTQKDSFDNVMHWYSDLQKFSPVNSLLLLGINTPSQSRDVRVVTSERAFKMAEGLRTQYLETTLADKEMLLLVVRQMTDLICKTFPPLARTSNMVTIAPAVRDKPRRRLRFPFCAS